MKDVAVSSYHYVYKLAYIPEPRIRSAKEWRRHQVAMKLLHRRIDDYIKRMIIGDPPKPEPLAGIRTTDLV